MSEQMNLLRVSTALLAFSACSVGWNHTSDATLERRFKEHEGEFETLLAEVQADSQLESLQPREVRYAGHRIEIRDQELSKLDQVGLTRERWQHYQNEMRALGLSAVNSMGGSVEFRVDSGLLSNGDSYKGFYYGLVAPYRVTNSLDRYRRTEADEDQTGNWGVCKALKRNWYIYLFVNR